MRGHNVANYSANLAPDLLAKVVYQSPNWGTYELFGVARFFRNRIFPNDTGSKPSAVGAYNDTTVGGGVGGSLGYRPYKNILTSVCRVCGVTVQDAMAAARSLT